MTLEQIRGFCTSLPHVTEKIQWGDDLVFKVGGKMFCVAYTGVPTNFSFRPDDEQRSGQALHRDGRLFRPTAERDRFRGNVVEHVGLPPSSVLARERISAAANRQDARLACEARSMLLAPVFSLSLS